MTLDIVKSLARVKIALAVTAAASALQAIYHPSKAVLLGPIEFKLVTFLLFGLIKVIGLMTLSLLSARAFFLQGALGGNHRNADTRLFIMLAATLLLALYVFLGVRIIKSETFVAQWGTGIPQNVAGLTLLALFLLISKRYSGQQYYDIAAVVGVESAGLQMIDEHPERNSQFVLILVKKLAIMFIPLLGVHFYIAKTFLKDGVSITSSLADALVTCAVALASGYAIASSVREMGDCPNAPIA